MFPEKIRPLLIEDNPGDARLVQELLCGGRLNQFELDWTDRLVSGLERLERGGIDAVLLDLSLPDCRGLETIARVHACAPEIPIVVLTGLGDESVMLEAVHNGAQDYLEKSRLDSESLTRALRYAIQRKRAEQEVRLRALLSATVAALGEEALGNPRLEDFMRKAAVLVAGNLKIDFCQVLESSPVQGGAPLAVASASADPAANHDAVSWDALADCAIRAASPIIVEDFSTEKRFAVSPPLPERGITSGACVPVLGRERPFGALGVFTLARRRFDSEDLSFLQSVANVLAAAIERKCYEDEMVRARDLALETSRLKSAFLANMSHEIRTPLSGVIGMTELLLDTGLDAAQEEFAETIRSSADTLLTVVNDILDFSRISADKVVLDHKPFEPARILKTVTTLLSVEARRKGLALALQVAPDVPATLYGDPVRLRQVLSNLVGNAVKFTDRGGVNVSARLEAESEDEVIVRFEIRDTGIGIPAHLMGKLFQPFSQVDDSSARRYGGTGLGLVISAKLAGLMGGEIAVESEPGRGSTFHFNARFGKSAPGPALAHGNGAASPPPGASRQGIAVLVVEDDRVNQKVATLQLRKLGYEPRVASNGREALEELARTSYPVVLMDCQMPDVDGYETTAEIRRRERSSGRHTIVLALTAHALEGERSKCLSAGMDGFITKPIRIEDLAAVLNSCLDGPRETGARSTTARYATDT